MRSFLIGALGYPLLEIMWRRRTHWSMSVAGGISTAFFHRIARLHRPLWQKALLGGAAVTLVEGVCGLLWNRQYRVWDYRNEPVNWHGQVCMRFTAIWCVLSGLWMCLDKPQGLT